MTSNNNNFLLKIHMEEKNSIKEIYLNKERRSFIFVNEECVSDLIIPEFKITSLNMILENISDSNGDDSYYAEYEKSGKLLREYDHAKINLLIDMVTKITVNDFLNHQKNIKINDYYVDNIVDAYNCVLPNNMKKLISYTTNGLVFDDSNNLYLLSHDDVVNYKGNINNFIPLMKRENNYIGFDYKEFLYKEYSGTETINESKTLKDILLTTDDSSQPDKTIETDLFIQELREKIDERLIEEQVNIDYETTLKNIDLQLARLNAKLVSKPKKEEYKYVEKHNEEKIKIKNEIVEGIRKSIKELESRNNNLKIDNSQNVKTKIKNNHIKTLDSKTEKKPQKASLNVPKIRNVKSKENEKLTAFLIEYDKQHKEEKDRLKKENKKIKTEQETKNKKLFREFLSQYDEKLAKEASVKKQFKEFLTQYEDKLSKEVKDKKLFKEFLSQYDEKLAKEANVKKQFKEFLTQYEDKLSKEVKDKKLFKEFLSQYDEKLAKDKKIKKEKEVEKMKKEEIEKETLNNLLVNSINHGITNYKVNFNDTHKLVVEHLPYYEISNEFDVIQIPEIEIDKITLIPDGQLNFGKIKLVVETLSNNKVDLLVKSATTIVDIYNNKFQAGQHIVLDLNNEVTLRLNKKNAMETWTFKMEKSTFAKELRNIDYSKVINCISKLQSYKKIGNIEKYELQKSVMLFIDFVMKYNEFEKLDELYEILENEPTLYEEYITKYNINHSLQLKDCLNTYDDKKEYLIKLNYINGLIDAKWLDYPRYIFETHNYFQKDNFLQNFIDELNDSLQEDDFANYLKNLFKEYEMFKNLDNIGKENLDKCLEYLSVLYKYNSSLGEKYKYQIEKTFMIGATEEDISLLISKICRRGIKDYSLFIEYDEMMKNKYRLGQLKYPIFSESFGIEDIRNGGEDYEY